MRNFIYTATQSPKTPGNWMVVKFRNEEDNHSHICTWYGTTNSDGKLEFYTIDGYTVRHPELSKLLQAIEDVKQAETVAARKVIYNKLASEFPFEL